MPGTRRASRGSSTRARDGPSSEQISNDVLRYASDPEADKAAFADMIAFNFLVLGTDAHAKNFSVIHLPGRRMFLAPLYDVLLRALRRRRT